MRRTPRRRWRAVAAVVLAVAPTLGDASLFAALAAKRQAVRVPATSAGLQTLEWALAQAYINNPQLNAQRAQVRVTDENVPQALSGYRPRVTGTVSGGIQYQDTITRTSVPSGTVYSDLPGTFPP